MNLSWFCSSQKKVTAVANANADTGLWVQSSGLRRCCGGKEGSRCPGYWPVDVGVSWGPPLSAFDLRPLTIALAGLSLCRQGPTDAASWPFWDSVPERDPPLAEGRELQLRQGDQFTTSPGTQMLFMVSLAGRLSFYRKRWGRRLTRYPDHGRTLVGTLSSSVRANLSSWTRAPPRRVQIGERLVFLPCACVSLLAGMLIWVW